MTEGMMKDNELQEYINEEIAARMSKCGGHDENYCNITICFECDFCEKNLKLEDMKLNDICPKCLSFGNISKMIYLGSVTRECNQCGGTGKFLG
jgi:hypothetical protein